jgi:hypothetical protein
MLLLSNKGKKVSQISALLEVGCVIWLTIATPFSRVSLNS